MDKEEKEKSNLVKKVLSWEREDYLKLPSKQFFNKWHKNRRNRFKLDYVKKRLQRERRKGR